MKSFLVILSVFLYFPIYSQTYTKNILYEDDIITRYEIIESYENGLVAQKRYITTKKGYEEMSKEELFMNGAQLEVQKLDSIITYFYKENWDFDRKEFSKNPTDYPSIRQNHEFIKSDKFIQLRGKFNSVAPLEIELKNNITKTRVFNISVKIGSNIINEKITLTPFQSSTFIADILLNQGIHRSKISIYENDELLEEIKLENIGYDITDDNIYSNENDAINNTIKLNSKLLFIDNNGDERLIQIKKNDEIFNFTIKHINSIDLSEFTNGNYMLEIVDLGIGERKFCYIELEH